MVDLLNAKRKIFISYSFQDAEMLSFIKNRLGECGFEIVDYTSKVSSQVISKSFESAIKKCDCFIYIVTEKNQYAQYEYEIAQKFKKNIFVYIKENTYFEDLKSQFGNKIVHLWKNENELAVMIIGDLKKFNFVYPYKGYQFEVLIEELFDFYGCSTKRESLQRDEMYDIYAQKNNIKFYIEVKTVRQMIVGKETISKAIDISQNIELQSNERFVLVVANIVPNKMKKQLREYKNLLVLDISNLLFMVRKSERLKTKLLSLLEFSVDEIEHQKPDDLITLLGESDNILTEKEIIKELISEIKEWKPIEKKSGEYENLCYRVLNILFAPDLSLWKEQQKSNEDLYRFDLICKIKDNISEAFWGFIERYFNSKYIIFEFKNYDKKISQKEIYTTEKYLFAKALRCLAIIISCYGEDNNSKKAIKGTLRENGKLILSLSNDDLITMLEGKLSGVSPAEYLYGVLDAMLIELDK